MPFLTAVYGICLNHLNFRQSSMQVATKYATDSATAMSTPTRTPLSVTQGVLCCPSSQTCTPTGDRPAEQRLESDHKDAYMNLSAARPTTKVSAGQQVLVVISQQVFSA